MTLPEDTPGPGPAMSPNNLVDTPSQPLACSTA